MRCRISVSNIMVLSVFVAGCEYARATRPFIDVPDASSGGGSDLATTPVPDLVIPEADLGPGLTPDIGSNPQLACTACIASSCPNQVQSCTANGDCNRWWGCQQATGVNCDPGHTQAAIDSSDAVTFCAADTCAAICEIDVCTVCKNEQCKPQVDACVGDVVSGGCNDILTCLTTRNCGSDATCGAQCRSLATPAAIARFDAATQCNDGAAVGACALRCGAQGGGGGGGGNANPCTTCVVNATKPGQACVVPFTACTGDLACQNYDRCIGNCALGDTSCLRDCVDLYGVNAANENNNLYQCLTYACAAACGL